MFQKCTSNARLVMGVTLIIIMIICGQPSMLTSEIPNEFGLLMMVAFLRSPGNLPSGGRPHLTIDWLLDMKQIARTPTTPT